MCVILCKPLYHGKNEWYWAHHLGARQQQMLNPGIRIDSHKLGDIHG